MPPTPPSPSVGARRKVPVPRLPLSAFSPPNSGTSETFPLPPSPSTVNPESIVDAHVIATSVDPNLTQWKKEAGQVLGGRIGGIVLYLPADSQEAAKQLAASNATTLISVVSPFRLEDSKHELPPHLSGLSLPVSLSTVFSKPVPQGAESLKWALQQGRPVDIDIQGSMSDDLFESLEDLLASATTDTGKVPPVVISNWLPPPHDLELPIVKLMNHPTYRAFQSRTAALSLIPHLYMKYLPPNWAETTPSTSESEAKRQKEWKRRIKMFLGPVMEAFGLERIIFGSSPSASSRNPSNVGDWYEIARESLAELGVEQEAVDAVFCDTARKVYGS